MKTHLRKPEGRTSFSSFVNSGPPRVVGCETATTTIPTNAAITTITLTVMLHLSSGRTRVLLVSVLHTVGQCRKNHFPAHIRVNQRVNQQDALNACHQGCRANATVALYRHAKLQWETASLDTAARS